MNLKAAYSHILSVTETSNPEATQLATALILRDMIEKVPDMFERAVSVLGDTWEQEI